MSRPDSFAAEFAAAFGDRFHFDDPLKGARDFRQKWFGADTGGTPFFFLFTKNLSITNVQFAELLSLLRLHTFDRTGARAKALYFVTSEEFDRTLVEMVEPFEGDRALGDLLSQLYWDVYSRTVLVDPYYGSCNVFLPPNLTLHLAAVAGEAGYLHSCGYSIFVRNMVKAEPSLLRNKLSAHLRHIPPDHGKRVRFLVYADEDFSRYDRAQASALDAGLDDTKIHVEKAWFRIKRLVDILDDLHDSMSDRLAFGQGGSYLSDRSTHGADSEIDPTRTIWLVQDRAIGSPCEQPGSDRYYICYDQLFRARNPIYLFDENKPAWHDHTTLPPTLAAGMLNVVRRPERADIHLGIADPFVGTGTSLLEALRFDQMTFRGSDTASSTKVLIDDNLEFFRSSLERLDEIHRQLIVARNELRDALGAEDPSIESTSIFQIATQTLGASDLAAQARQPESLPRLTPEALPDRLADRVLAYIAMRASKRYSGTFVRAAGAGNVQWCEKYLLEADLLIEQVSALLRLRGLEAVPEEVAPNLVRRYGLTPALPTGVVLVQDDYSIACMPREHVVAGVEPHERDHAQSQRFDLVVGPAGDALNLPRDQFDVVIGDPPYGFNTTNDARDLAKLYQSFAKVALQSLRDGGDLILCLPERSHSGRYSPAFTHRSLVVQQLFVAAGEVERQLLFPHDRVEGAEALCEADYYWESQRALRRTVLHVQVRHMPANDRTN